MKQAIKLGYRHIDTAMLYGSEADLGKSIAESIREGIVRRKDLFIVTKLPTTCNKPSLVLPAVKQSLKNLNLDFVDLYLVHTPVSRALVKEMVTIEGKLDHNGEAVFNDIDPSVTWKEMENPDLGFAKSIGISNYNSEQVKSLMTSCRIKPVTNQVESHVLLQQNKLRNLCNQYGIPLTAYTVLGGQPRDKTGPAPNLLENPTVKTVAEKHGKLPAQVLVRWQQNNI
uniref:1,5-anhydro-D-fructose reductase-like n=1 Tax=Ciona intestinalis TaxID=7719 RepID=UPI0002B8E7AC|nr:1,5-anhydro-D-fructose reductase-like [Ciona intestinalis]|eukprot:XP_026690105.1 1,5-anhydro-D-fructose reductase-like [Ciona intestinalis]